MKPHRCSGGLTSDEACRRRQRFGPMRCPPPVGTSFAWRSKIVGAGSMDARGHDPARTRRRVTCRGRRHCRTHPVQRRAPTFKGSRPSNPCCSKVTVCALNASVRREAARRTIPNCRSGALMWWPFHSTPWSQRRYQTHVGRGPARSIDAHRRSILNEARCGRAHLHGRAGARGEARAPVTATRAPFHFVSPRPRNWLESPRTGDPGAETRGHDDARGTIPRHRGNTIDTRRPGALSASAMEAP